MNCNDTIRLGFLCLAGLMGSALAASGQAAPSAADCTWNPQSPGPGDVVRFQVPLSPGESFLRGSFDRLELVPEVSSTELRFMVGIGRREVLGPRRLELEVAGPAGAVRRVEASIPVVAKDYPISRLQVAPELAHMSAETRWQVLREASSARWKVPAQGTLSKAWVVPAIDHVTSPFGSLRYFNGIRHGYHLGVDLRAWLGTPIKSPAQGRVVGISKEVLGGTTVRVDHGAGWVSHLMHLDNVQVHPGQELSQGQAVAQSGMTGRVTAPHLHWALTWKGRYVDPLQMIPRPQPGPETVATYVPPTQEL